MRYANTLIKLKEEGELNYSQVPKALLKELLDDDLIDIKTVSPTRKKIIVKQEFYESYNNIEQIKQATTRAELIKAKTDTKRKRVSPQEGLFLNGNCTIDSVKLPLFDKSSLFLKDLPTIDKNILVIGVENFENLIYFKQQLYLFRENDILFVFRNKKMLELFEKIENRIIYFGDYDLMGISIYLNEVLPRNRSIEFFIPDNIEELIKQYGSRSLYKKQINKNLRLHVEDEKIQQLMDMIHKYQKSLEQEFLIL